MGCPFLTTSCFQQQRCSLRYQDHCHASRILLGTQWHVTPVMTSGCGSPLPATTALHSGLSPGQKKRDLCECLAHLTCTAQPSVTPAHISGWDLWTRKHGSLLHGLTLSCYTWLLKVQKGKGGAVLPTCALLTKPRSCQLANIFI